MSNQKCLYVAWMKVASNIHRRSTREPPSIEQWSFQIRIQASRKNSVAGFKYRLYQAPEGILTSKIFIFQLKRLPIGHPTGDRKISAILPLCIKIAASQNQLTMRKTFSEVHNGSSQTVQKASIYVARSRETRETDFVVLWPSVHIFISW